MLIKHILTPTFSALVLSALGMVFTQKAHAQKPSAFTFYVGTYTNKESKGIYKYALTEKGKLERIGLMSTAKNPSFLSKSKDDKYLVSVNEMENGMISLYLIGQDTLQLVNQQSSGGAYPCHITMTKNGHVLTANYGDGKVALLKINSTGSLEGPLDIQQHTGSGTTPRQEGPHAHSVWLRNKEKDLISLDLGTNELWFSSLDLRTDRLVIDEPEKIAMEAGAGPRHMTFHPSDKWAYVVNELSSSVTLLSKGDKGSYEVNESISTLPLDFEGESTCADIHISDDGQFLYASNRGHDSLVIYQINSTNGSLSLVAHESTLGKIPRSFSLSPDNRFLLVANQNTNSIISFSRNQTNGTLTFVDQIEAPTPVCILF